MAWISNAQKLSAEPDVPADLESSNNALDSDHSLPKPSLTITCTDSPQMLVGTKKLGVVAKCGDDSAHSIASLAKVITALVVLDSVENDAELDQTITIDTEDMGYLAVSNNEGGTSMQVFEGETFSKRLCLQGMILASANNLANTLVRNQFGSLEAYREKALEYLSRHSIEGVEIGNDASGLDNGTKARPSQLFEIAKLAMDNPTLAATVQLRSIEFPTVFSGGELTETITNGNSLIEVGFNGIKIGYTDEAGRCILFSRNVEDSDDLIIGMTLGDKNDANGFSFVDAQNISYQLELALESM
ncbi:MAG: serine hydrolase [Candidatus Ancillula sp.]|nr:serine hydrolase [Candidatus Ancillula sp.]